MKTMYRCRPSVLIAAAVMIVCGAARPSYAQPAAKHSATVVTVFDSAIIHFTPDEPRRYDTDHVKAADNGRAMLRRIDLPRLDPPVRVTAHLTLKPIPRDDLSVMDKWDRAGSIRLERRDGPPLELIKFVTAYGGRTEHHVDISELAAMLQGECLITAFIDTWVSPGWKIDLSLEFDTTATVGNADWVHSLMLEDSFNAADMGSHGIEVAVDVPDGGLKRVFLQYYVSGHCTDGRGADEFVPKDNVILVDDIVVYRFRPWREDCKELRAINPYCKKWSDGSWSSDFSRSGWCPGAEVLPLRIDLTDHLTPGRHRVRFVIEDIRPADRDGNFGYWRVSSRLIGYGHSGEHGIN